MMIRVLIAILGGLAAWRYRSHIKDYVNNQLPDLREKTMHVLDKAADKFNAARPSVQERRDTQA